MELKDGGPAFPHQHDMVLFHDNDRAKPAQTIKGVWSGGMTLRDYFAAKAMQAEIITTFSDATPEAANAFIHGRDEAGHTNTEHVAFNAYRLADAMLAERDRTR